jgi:hypothetical protein
MIGLLDPALFLPRSDREIEQDVDRVILASRRYAIELIPFEEYWHDLWTTLAKPLEKQLDPAAKRSLHELRKLAKPSTEHIPPLDIDAGKVWRNGFAQLFDKEELFGRSWEDRMACATLRAIAACQTVVMFTRRVSGRNLRVHAAGETTLDENTRWVLHLQPKGIGHRQVLCVYHPRNLTERWTARFDWRLPAVSDGAKYPFCPPDKWWKASTIAHHTVHSKPAWIDNHGNGWARPNIPGGAGYHWDVMIESPALVELVGLSQINVVEYGAPPREGLPGQLHYVPVPKRGRPTGRGWNC